MTEDLRRSRGSRLMKFLTPSSKKSKTSRKEASLGSTASLSFNTGDPRLKGQVPAELSLEERLTETGSELSFLRVYCERVRSGDFFKTIKVYGSSSAQRCINDLIRSYYKDMGEPSDFQLFEVFGHVTPLEKPGEPPVLTFNEIKARPIPADETLHTLFSVTSPGQGAARRIELRPRHAKKDQPGMPITPRRSVDVPSGEAPVPFKRRSVNRASLTTRDSRRQRVQPQSSQNRTPNGPYLLQMRGQNPVKDILLHDLGSLIDTNSTCTQFTIGSKPTAHIRIYPSPEEDTYLDEVVYAKLIGCDQPITTNGSDVLNGAIYLEPAAPESTQSTSAASIRIPPIYINDEQMLPQSNMPHSGRRLLRPGDFVRINSDKRGYMFMFKDPRWIPDHRLEIALPSTATSPTNKNGTMVIRRSIQIERENATPSDRSSDTDSSCRNRQQFKFPHRISVSKQERLPRSSCLRPVITGLFIQASVETTPLQTPPDRFSTPSHWSKIDPWRSAALFSHLVRTTAGFIVHSNPGIPNKDVDVQSIPVIREYAMNHMKDIHGLLFECHQKLTAESETLIYPHLWLTLLCYDIGVLLSPGWLEPQECPEPKRHSKPSNRRRSSLPLGDGFESSGSSTCSSPSSSEVEMLPVVVELKDLAFRLADDSVRNVVKLAFEEISPHITYFYQEEALSPASAHSKESGFSSARTSIINNFKLQERLQKFSRCFHQAFYPSGFDEHELASPTPTSPFRTTNNKDNSRMRGTQASGYSRTGRRSSMADGSDPHFSTGTDSESGDHWGLIDYARISKPGNNCLDSGGSRLVSTTEVRVEAIVWRQVLSLIAHDILYAILSTASIPVDCNTGERLLAGVNWLQQWLVTNKLDAHRRPLNIIVEFANLLSTPKHEIINLNWSAMRSMYPEVPPAILKFMLDEYSIEPELRPTEGWEVDTQDLNAADEDPFEVIGLIMDGWRSKECVYYQKFASRSAPTHRPRNPAELFKLRGTENLIRRLDKSLEEKSIIFRWSGLVSHYPPLRCISRLVDEPEGLILNRPESRQRITEARRNSSSIGRRHMTKPAFTAAAKHSQPTLSQSLISPPGLLKAFENNLDEPEFNDFVRPALSNCLPQRTVRNFGSDTAATTKTTGLNDDNVLYQLNELITSLTSGGLKRLKQSIQQPSPAITPPLRAACTKPGRPRNTLYESQPNLRAVYQSTDEFPELPGVGHSREYSAGGFRALTPGKRIEADENLTNKRDYGSLLHLNSAREIKPTTGDQDYARNVVNCSRDFGKFKQSVLSKGLDKLRTPVPESPAMTPKNPMLSLVGRSLGNLSLVTRPGYKPNIIVEENDSSGSHSDSDSLLVRRNDDLSDVMSRSMQANTILNVTLNRSPASGFGLKLEDGLRTTLDQPGVFVKEVIPNGPAENSGEIAFGDRILAINGHDLSSLTYADSLKKLRECGNQATFTIRRCYLSDPGQLLVRKNDVVAKGK